MRHITVPRPPSCCSWSPRAEKLGFGFSVSVVTLGWLLLPQNLMNMVGALAVAKIVTSYGGYRVAGIVGGVLLGIGFIGMMLATTVLWQFVLFAITTGLGSGLLQTTLSGRVSEVCEPLSVASRQACIRP